MQHLSRAYTPRLVLKTLISFFATSKDIIIKSYHENIYLLKCIYYEKCLKLLKGNI